MYHCVIVEDEQPARELLRMYLEYIPDVELVGSFDNAFAAFSFLQSHTVDLMFLDIQMPRMSGFELLRSLKSAPKVIMTTAYRDYALDAFELDVIDYLLKPVSQERFLKSISKFHSYTPKHQLVDQPGPGHEPYLFLKIGKEQIKVLLKDILYIEGLKDYIKVHTRDKMFIAYERLGYMEEKLPDAHFIRIHKSFIVALDKVSMYHNETAHVGSKELPIGRVYKQAFLNAIGKASTRK